MQSENFFAATHSSFSTVSENKKLYYCKHNRIKFIYISYLFLYKSPKFAIIDHTNVYSDVSKSPNFLLMLIKLYYYLLPSTISFNFNILNGTLYPKDTIKKCFKNYFIKILPLLRLVDALITAKKIFYIYYQTHFFLNASHQTLRCPCR